MGNYFGTDGVRGVANTELTPMMAYNIGAALAYSMTKSLGRAKAVAVGMFMNDYVIIIIFGKIICNLFCHVHRSSP